MKKLIFVLFIGFHTLLFARVSIDQTAKIYTKIIKVNHLIPATGIYVEYDNLINGWALKDNSILLTSGALKHLSRAEMAHLIAHELAHIQFGDEKEVWDRTKKIEDRADYYGTKYAHKAGYSYCKMARLYLRYYHMYGNNGGKNDTHSSNLKRFWRIYKYCRGV